jgi:hypothetical protein
MDNTENKFDIVDYVANALTGFTFTRSQVKYIVEGRGLADVESVTALTQKDKDLLTADCLRIIYTSPTQSASSTDQHGDFSMSRGSQYISDKKQIYKWMMALYKKWGENPFEDEELEGGLQWFE